jgi:hypothetical protein
VSSHHASFSDISPTPRSRGASGRRLLIPGRRRCARRPPGPGTASLKNDSRRTSAASDRGTPRISGRTSQLMSTTFEDSDCRPRPTPTTPVAASSPLDAGSSPGAVPMPASHDHSRLRTLARLWLDPVDLVGRARRQARWRRMVRPDAVPPSAAVMDTRVVLVATGCRPTIPSLGDAGAPCGRGLDPARIGAGRPGATAGDRADVVQCNGRRFNLHPVAAEHCSERGILTGRERTCGVDLAPYVPVPGSDGDGGPPLTISSERGG